MVRLQQFWTWRLTAFSKGHWQSPQLDFRAVRSIGRLVFRLCSNRWFTKSLTPTAWASSSENDDTPAVVAVCFATWGFPNFGSLSASHHPIVVHSHREDIVQGCTRIIASALAGSAAGRKVLKIWIWGSFDESNTFLCSVWQSDHLEIIS